MIQLEIDMCRTDPAHFLFNSGMYVWTFDSYEQGVNKIKPLPENKLSLRYILEQIHTNTRVFIPKSRQIMATWLVCAYLWWDARFNGHELNFVQSKKEEDAANLVFSREVTTSRISFMESRLPDYLKQPDASYAYGVIQYSNGSKIWGVPQGADIIRSYTPSIVFLDEAAFQPRAAESYRSAIAAARKIIAVSSAEPSWFGKMCGLQDGN
jgi:phage FluMu gp28-like protein